MHSSGQFVSLSSVSSMATTKESAALHGRPSEREATVVTWKGTPNVFLFAHEQNAGRIDVAGLNIPVVLCRDVCLADGGGLFLARSFVPFCLVADDDFDRSADKIVDLSSANVSCSRRTV